MSRLVRAFTPATERRIAARFAIAHPVTNARRILRGGGPGRGRWQYERIKTIGASQISVLMMGVHPYHSLFSLWHAKRSQWTMPQTDAQERGLLLEPGIMRRFAEAHPELVVGRANGVLWADPDRPWLSASPDYLTIDQDGVIRPLEGKTDEHGDWGRGPEDVPEHHWWQINQQCGVFAADQGYVARWNTAGYRDYLIDFDPARYDRAADTARRFLDDVRYGHGPEPDGHRMTLAALTDLYDTIDPQAPPARIPREWGDEIDALNVSIRELTAERDRYRNLIRALMGDAGNGFDSAGRIYTRTRRPRRGFTVAPTEIDSITATDPVRP